MQIGGTSEWGGGRRGRFTEGRGRGKRAMIQSDNVDQKRSGNPAMDGDDGRGGQGIRKKRRKNYDESKGRDQNIDATGKYTAKLLNPLIVGARFDA